MKKVLSLLVAFSMILSVFAAMPVITNASETTLEASLSYTHSSTKNAAVTMHSHPSRPYAISWSSSSDGYRNGYIAFPFGDVDLTGQYISKATLNLTISKTQNMNESNSGVNIYAVDYSLVDGTNAPTSDMLLTTYRMPDAVKNQGDYTYSVSIDIDLSGYLEEYPDAEGVGILFTNREDEYSLKGMVGFCGTADGVNAPTLSIEYGASSSVKLSLVDEEGAALGEKTVGELTSGNVFTVSEELAPYVVERDGKFYARGDIADIALEPGVNEIKIVYSEKSIQELIKPENVLPVISGSDVILPETIDALLSDGVSTVPVKVQWETKDAGDKVELKATYGEFSVEFTADVLSCDGNSDSFTGAGASSGAGFDKYNALSNVYNAGTVAFDMEFYINEGTNKLISYGDGTTSAFGSAAALLRYMNADVFEYHNGDWKESRVKCEEGKTYNLRTEINVTNKTYRMYIAGEDGVYHEVTDGNAAFRGNVATIDRFFFHGSGSNTGTDIVKSHRESWVNGFTNLTVNYLCDGEKVMDKTLKWGTNTSYTDNTKAIGNGEEIYVIPDFDNPPVKSSVTGEEDSFDVAVNLVTAKVSEFEATYVSEGDESIVLPYETEVEFSDGQSLTYQIKWDTDEVDTDKAGTYTAKGEIGELGIFAECEVVVKGVVNIEYTPGNNTVVTNNGGWNWYVEPSGTHIQPGDELATLFESGIYSSNDGYVFTEDKTYMGWVEDGGDIVISSLDHSTGEHKRVVIHDKLESDDHNNPAVIVLPDGRIMAVYTMHTNEPYLYYRVTKNPEDISEWHDEQFYYSQCTASNDTGTYNPTYPSVFVVHDDCGIEGNDVIYMGWRGVHWKPTLAKFGIPDENGVCEVVMGQTQFANTTYDSGAKENGGKSDGGRRPYSKYDYDVERNKLYITFTATHPDNEARNHIYYVELDIADQNLYTAKGRLLQPLPFENSTDYISQGANGTNGQWGIITVDLVNAYPELVVFDASENTGRSFTDVYGGIEHRGWTWDIAHNENGEPCIVYVDITATPPEESGKLPETYAAPGDEETDPEHATRAHHYYWYARWDKETGEWVKTFLTYGGKWWHQNYKQERCYSGGLTIDHNYPGNVIYLSIPTYGKYGNIFEVYRWESDDNGATWTKREALTKDSPTPNARPNAIYNYKMNSDGTHAGPRLLWKSGEYRYWLNYEYKTGVWTDYATEGFITQDAPEMFADFALLGEDGEELTELPVGEDVTVTAKFTISNLSIGDGQAKLAVAHYSKDNIFKKFTAIDSVIPARSVPQIGVIGAPKMVDDGSHSPWAQPENRSPMGDSEVVETIDYTATIEEGDRIALFAWGVGIEHPWHPLSDLNYSITTEGTEFLFAENFSYDGEELLILDKNEDTFKGWIAKGFNANGEGTFTDRSYAAITKAPFGNTALHLYRRGGGSIMASHALPDTNGEDYTLEFTMRYISELAWNRTDNIGFTLSHGIPGHAGDADNPSAYQLRHRTDGGNENGRGVVLFLKDSTAFDSGNRKTVANTGIPRDWDLDGLEQVDYSKGVGYFDPVNGYYIHDYNDSLMSGALLYVTVKVSPKNKTVETSVCDGYRTTTHTASYNGKDSVDWDENPIDTITFSLGNENVGEVYVDDINMYLTENN